MALSLAGNLGRQDKDDCVDLGDKKQLQVVGSSAVSKVILTNQILLHICIHIWRCGGSRGLGPRGVKPGYTMARPQPATLGC